jgi:hypothetical protein
MGTWEGSAGLSTCLGARRTEDLFGANIPHNTHRKTWGDPMRKTQKSAVVIGSTVALIGGGMAFAYWTTSGTGTGSATTGTSSSWAVTTGLATGGPLSPDGPSQSIAFHVKNNNTGVQHLSSVVVTVANADGSAWTSGNCSMADYTVGTPVFTGGDVASGATVDGTVSIAMNNLSTNQEDCKGVTVPLYVNAS